MDKKLQKPVVVAIMALITCFLWGSAFPCIKTGYELFQVEGVGSQILFAGYRFFLAGLFTFLIGCFMEKRILTMQRSSIPYVVGQGFLQTTVQYFLFYIGLANVTGAKGSIISGSNGLFAIVAAHFILKSEKMTGKKWLGCILGLAGVVVVNFTPGAWGEGFRLSGEGLFILCAVSYGISSVTLKLISHRESPITITAYQLMSGSAILIVIGWILGGTVTGFTIKSTVLFLYMALLSTVSFSLWTTLMRYNPVGRISIYTFSIPIFGVFLSGVFLGEQVLTMRNLAGLVLVCIGILVVNSQGKNLRR